MISNGGGLINVTLCDSFLDCAPVFTKSIAEKAFSLTHVLNIAFFALCHIYKVRRKAGDVMQYTSLFVSRETRVTHRSLCDKRARFAPQFCYNGNIPVPN